MWLSIIGRCTFVIQTASLRLKLPTNATMMSGMDSNIVGLLISFPFLALVIALAIALKKWCAISSESMRKVIHIGVSNWWFILLHYFNTLSYAQSARSSSSSSASSPSSTGDLRWVSLTTNWG